MRAEYSYQRFVTFVSGKTRAKVPAPFDQIPFRRFMPGTAPLEPLLYYTRQTHKQHVSKEMFLDNQELMSCIPGQDLKTTSGDWGSLGKILEHFSRNRQQKCNGYRFGNMPSLREGLECSLKLQGLARRELRADFLEGRESRAL